MNWTEIQSKWAAMARRVGSDQSPDADTTATPLMSEQPQPRDDTTEQRAPKPVERTVA